MNERMQQLANQAEKYADDNFKGESGYSEAYESKFAELIVEQMVDLLMIQHEAVASAHNYYAVAANLIQAEFGVKE